MAKLPWNFFPSSHFSFINSAAQVIKAKTLIRLPYQTAHMKKTNWQGWDSTPRQLNNSVKKKITTTKFFSWLICQFTAGRKDFLFMTWEAILSLLRRWWRTAPVESHSWKTLSFQTKPDVAAVLLVNTKSAINMLEDSAMRTSSSDLTARIQTRLKGTLFCTAITKFRTRKHILILSATVSAALWSPKIFWADLKFSLTSHPGQFCCGSWNEMKRIVDWVGKFSCKNLWTK